MAIESLPLESVDTSAIEALQRLEARFPFGRYAEQVAAFHGTRVHRTRVGSGPFAVRSPDPDLLLAGDVDSIRRLEDAGRRNPAGPAGFLPPARFQLRAPALAPARAPGYRVPGLVWEQASRQALRWGAVRLAHRASLR
mgnify:CR=1 FL=1